VLLAILSTSDAVYICKIGSRLLLRQPLSLGTHREAIREVFALGLAHEPRQLAPAIHDFASFTFARENRKPLESCIYDDGLHDPHEVAGVPPIFCLGQEFLRRVKNLCRPQQDTPYERVVFPDGPGADGPARYNGFEYANPGDPPSLFVAVAADIGGNDL